jgi:hypothetical protein
MSVRARYAWNFGDLKIPNTDDENSFGIPNDLYISQIIDLS